MKRFLLWCKKEIVLCIAMLLAIASSFVVQPDRQYVTYIDFRTLAILFCLMAVMAGMQKLGFFDYIAGALLQKVKGIRGLVFILIMLCFFSSMLITNDVALITFVPFTFIVLKMVLGNEAEKLVVPVVVMQTIAANLGSMLTPIGNPQNLYLYGKSAMPFSKFLLLMLPYTIMSFVILGIWCMLFPYKGEKKITVCLEREAGKLGHIKELLIYGLLFVVCVLAVTHLLPWNVMLLVVILTIFVLDRKVFAEVDYALLLTFIGFFVFVGNMGRVPAFSTLIQELLNGNEVLLSVIASQFMSNVPAALLLSGFTSEYALLIVGTNLGGLGTMIASMASLISFKYVGKEYKQLRGKYVWLFTVANLLFLAVLLGFVMINS